MKPLPYHNDRDHLRRELLGNQADYFAFRYPREPGADIDPEKADHHTAAVLGSGYAYNLAAAIQWINRNVDEDTADRFAAWLSDSLTNGEPDGLNEDLSNDTLPGDLS